MPNLICRKCGFKFKEELIIKDDKAKKLKKTRCPRCNNENISSFSSVIKLYYECKKNHVFKINEFNAIELMKRKERPTCPICGSTVTIPTKEL